MKSDIFEDWIELGLYTIILMRTIQNRTYLKRKTKPHIAARSEVEQNKKQETTLSKQNLEEEKNTQQKRKTSKSKPL